MHGSASMRTAVSHQEIVRHRRFFERVFRSLGFAEVQDWHNLKRDDVIKHGGKELLKKYYENSVVNAMVSLFPEVEWQLWRFSNYGTNVWADLTNHEKFFQWVAECLNIIHPEMWYNINKYSVYQHHGETLLRNHYSDSCMSALQTLYPEYEWQPWRFPECGQQYWENIHHHRQFFQLAANKLGIHKPIDWYRVTMEDINNLGGADLLKKYYNGSHVKALQILYPEIMESEQHKELLRWIEIHLNIEVPDDWYKVSKDEFLRSGGGILLRHYDNNLCNMLQALYPEIEWLPWKFVRLPNGFWDDPKQQKAFFDWLGRQLGIENAEDWYKVTCEDINNNGGSSLLRMYHSSPIKALQSVYPDVEWHPWRFAKLPSGYWDDVEHHKQYLIWLAYHKGVKEPVDWYSVSRADIEASGGQLLLNDYHNNSIGEVLQVLHPNVQWQPWTSNFQRSLEQFQSLEHRLSIQSPQDWHSVTLQHILSHDGGNLLNQFGGSMYNMLKTFYPSHEWKLNPWGLLSDSKTQQFLKRSLLRILPQHVEVESNVTLNMFAELKYVDTSQYMQVDCWIPALNTAIEYQGTQHYIDNNLIHGNEGVAYRYSKDAEKRIKCNALGIQLLTVPFWWDGELHTLAATLAKHLPQVMLNSSCLEAK